jgi:hypothetical protein
MSPQPLDPTHPDFAVLSPVVEALGLGPVSTEEFISVRPVSGEALAILRGAGHLD